MTDPVPDDEVRELNKRADEAIASNGTVNAVYAYQKFTHALDADRIRRICTELLERRAKDRT